MKTLTSKTSRLTRTKTSERRLRDVARYAIAPDGVVATAYPAVAKKCLDLGIIHDDWQQGLCKLILGKREDGLFAATVGGIVMSIPRQVGKTFTVGSIVVALCLLHPGVTVLWTAHRSRTSDETFAAMKGMTSRAKVKPFMHDPRLTNGEQVIRFRNGSRIMFGARESGFGRGFSEVDIEVFDEAQILSSRALEDMVAATNQSKHLPGGALLFYMGTPPRPSDPSEAFEAKRRKALAGESRDCVYVEFSADDDANPDDMVQLAKANPSFPQRTPLESIQRLRENLPDVESWRREGMGIWDRKGATSLVPLPVWESLRVPAAPVGGRTSYGVKFSTDGSLVSLAVAVKPVEGPIHVEVIPHPQLELASVPLSFGTDWIEEFLIERWRDSAAITIDGKAGAVGLVQALVSEGVSRRVLNPAGVGETPSVDQAILGHTSLLAAIVAGTVTHYGQVPLTAAVAGAEKRKIGQNGGWGWKPVRPDVDVTPLDAVTLAYLGATTSKRDPGRKQRLL